MKCTNCQQNDASVYIEQAIGHEVTKIHLCNLCATIPEMNLGFPFPFTGEGKASMHNFWFAPESVRREMPTCAACNYSFERFKKSSLLGCAVCYDAFRKELLGVFAKVQPGNKHIGKAPNKHTEPSQTDHELATLKASLKAAIAAEEYEEAASLRDVIRGLEGVRSDG